MSWNKKKLGIKVNSLVLCTVQMSSAMGEKANYASPPPPQQPLFFNFHSHFLVLVYIDNCTIMKEEI